MIAAASIQRERPHLMAGLAIALAVALIGATSVLRGPDPVLPAPMAAERPVVMPDGRELYVQKYEVTIGEWNACHDAGACLLALRTPRGMDAATTPATGLSYADVAEYLAWIGSGARHPFRLPTAREWAVMASDVLPEDPDPIFTDPALSWASAYLTEGLSPRRLMPQGSFSTSAEGVADLDGSVWEWTQDCHDGADGDPGARSDPSRCPAFYVGGEHLAAMSYLVRDPARGGCAVGSPPAHLGVRLVSDRPW
ncbi:formylglycine-generating enzyme family protein [Roseovarius spongiae]|uniref:Formylglycine-generating enzyme family protein n=1 Tax=Roseovarius spongiae TaxID=2320272 RepID=A0A3A8AWQ4_9RHOB|nr:SUMF1/EgtB/PvdO family nonheme iron enzyme [Roseovarius spongiae]RKF16177.1 formylglycine-generating enzyme family protein [Roseovarius spongiae]